MVMELSLIGILLERSMFVKVFKCAHGIHNVTLFEMESDIHKKNTRSWNHTERSKTFRKHTWSKNSRHENLAYFILQARGGQSSCQEHDCCSIQTDQDNLGRVCG